MTQWIEKVTSDVSRVSGPWLPKTENLAFLVKICKIENIKNWFMYTFVCTPVSYREIPKTVNLIDRRFF